MYQINLKRPCSKRGPGVNGIYKFGLDPKNIAGYTSDKLTVLKPVEWFQVRNGYANMERCLATAAVQ